MTPSDVVRNWVDRHTGHRLLLVDDFYDLVAWPDPLAGPPPEETFRRVIEAWGNLGFRARYEPLRDTTVPLLILRKRPDCFLPDVEAQLTDPQQRVRVTPQWLLQQATGDETWPPAVDSYFEVCREHFEALLLAHRRFRRQPRLAFHDQGLGLGEENLLDVLLSALLDLDLWSQPAPTVFWHRFFAGEPNYAALSQHFPSLAQRFMDWIRQQPAPVSWLTEHEPRALVTILGLTHLLEPHLADPVALLRQLNPRTFWLPDLSLDLLQRFCSDLEAYDPELFKQHLDVAEAALDGPLRAGLLEALPLDDPGRALAFLGEPCRSPRLLIMALRTLLDQGVHHPTEIPEADWETGLRQGFAGAERLAGRQHEPTLRLHLRALAALRTVVRSQPGPEPSQLSRWPPAQQLKTLLSWTVASNLLGLATAAGELSHLLREEDLHDPRFSARENKTAFQQLVSTLWSQARQVRAQVQEADRLFGQALATSVGDWAQLETIPLVHRFWSHFFLPLWREQGQPASVVVVFQGLRWDLWEQVLRPALADRFEARAQPMVGILPGVGDVALRRFLAGDRWQPAYWTWPLPSVLAAALPGLRVNARPPARPGLPEEWALFQLAAGPLEVVGVTLLDPAGVPFPGVAEALTDPEAARQLGAQFRPWLESFPPEALLIIVSTHGFTAVAQPLTWPSAEKVRFLSARCAVVPKDIPLPDTESFEPPELGLPPRLFPEIRPSAPSQTLLFATGSRYFAGVTEGHPPSFAGGGLSLAELVVPVVVLTPQPQPDQSLVEVSGLIVADEYQDGKPGELALLLALRGGALMDVATVACNLSPASPLTVPLEAGTRKRVALSFTPHLDPGAQPVVELPVEVLVTVGPTQQRRLGRIRVRRAG